MFKKAVFVILCLMAHYECTHFMQPRIGERNIQESFTELISDGIGSEMLKCNISISEDALYVCNLPLRPLRKVRYFSYDEALCITLNDFVERLSALCNGKKLTKLQLERSDLDVKNASVLCGKMRSVLNNTFSDTKNSERKEWIIALKNKLNNEKMCEDACIRSDGINPVCLTLLQINSHMISNLSEKHDTSATTDDSETTSTNKKQNISNNPKAASNVDQEDVQAISQFIPISLHVQGKGQQVQVVSEQEDDIQELTTENSYEFVETITTVSSKNKVVKDDIKISDKEIPVNKPVNSKHINGTVVKDNILRKQSSNTQETNNDHIMKKPSSSDTQKKNVESGINELSPSDPDKTIKNPILNKLSLGRKKNDKSSDTNENNKDVEKKKLSPVAGETNNKTDKPSSKQEDHDKGTDLNKPSANVDVYVEKPLPEPAVDEPKDKNSDDKTENSPEVSQDSKTQSSDKSKTVIDSSKKKMSVPEKEDDVEQTQAQSPDTESEITEKDQTISDGNTSNEEVGEKNIGENEDGIGFEDANPLVSDDNNVVQSKSTLPEIDEIMKNTPEKVPYTHTFVNAEDSHFFAYFMTMVIICIIGYLVYHNKQKIFALALEGRSRRSTRRRPNTSGYRKLDSNLEEAVTSACSTSVTHVIY